MTTKHDGFRIAIVSAHARHEIVSPLVEGTTSSLVARGVARRDIVWEHVLRPYDLPFAAKRVIDQESGKLDGVICLGLLVRDELADKFDFQSQAIAQGIMKLNVKGSIPVLYGVLTCMNHQQACKFIGEGEGENVSADHGSEWARALIELIRIQHKIEGGKPIVL